MDYSGFREKLNRNHSWPSVYMFKFIIPDDPRLLDQVQKLFSSEAEIQYKKSRNGKYISLTGKEVMVSAEEVIKVYRNAENIEHIIAL